MTEKRRDPRFDRTLRFHVSSGHAEGVAAESVNISTRGLYCEVDQYIPPFSKLKIAMELPYAQGGSGRLECEGVVVRVDPASQAVHNAHYHLAIYFLNLSCEMAAIVAKYLGAED